MQGWLETRKSRRREGVRFSELGRRKVYRRHGKSSLKWRQVILQIVLRVWKENGSPLITFAANLFLLCQGKHFDGATCLLNCACQAESF